MQYHAAHAPKHNIHRLTFKTLMLGMALRPSSDSNILPVRSRETRVLHGKPMQPGERAGCDSPGRERTLASSPHDAMRLCLRLMSRTLGSSWEGGMWH